MNAFPDWILRGDQEGMSSFSRMGPRYPYMKAKGISNLIWVKTLYTDTNFQFRSFSSGHSLWAVSYMPILLLDVLSGCFRAIKEP